MWKLCVTAAIAYVLGQMTVLIAVIVLGTSRSLSTQGYQRAHPVHRDTPSSPGTSHGDTQAPGGDLGRWSFPSRNGDQL